MTTPTPMSDETLAQLVKDVSEKVPKMADRSKLDDDLAILNTRILTTLQEHGLKRLQLPTGAIVMIVQQADRQTIVKEKLLEAGVSMKQIDAATVPTPIRPFIRVDAPKMETEQPAGETATDAAAPARVQ